MNFSIDFTAILTKEQLVRETLAYEQARSGVEMPSLIVIDVEEFEQRVSRLQGHYFTFTII